VKTRADWGDAPSRRHGTRVALVCRVAILLACALAAGCVDLPVGRLEMASTRAEAPERPATLTRRARAESCVWVVGPVPIGFPNLSAALDRALADAGATALWDVDVTYEIRYVPPLGRACYAVAGAVP
jgi:hypothetical protein